MKNEQDELERQLWQDRRNIYRKYEEKVKVAQTKCVLHIFHPELSFVDLSSFRATLVGDSGLSKHEAEVSLVLSKRAQGIFWL